jgi:hypothetical protein
VGATPWRFKSSLAHTFAAFFARIAFKAAGSIAARTLIQLTESFRLGQGVDFL